jgi:pantetheine-phosphate adenylyltransferase
MKSCIYPGSFDPITLGHLDIIKRAASMFETVYVAIGNNSSKSGTFTVDERLSLISVATKSIPNVKSVSFNGLLADYCYELGCKVVIKGVRNFQDFDYERLLNDVGQTQQSGIETITLFAKTELSHVSSTASKELLKYNGLIDGYVPLNVKEAMEAKMLGQYILGVTGEIGMGKSHFSKRLVKMGDVWNGAIREIDLDKIGHDILHTRTEPVYLTLRENIIKEFSLGGDVIDRQALGSIVFNDLDALNKLNSMMRIPMLTRIRKEIGRWKGILILNGALLAEAEFLTLCNNNIVVVKSSSENQFKALQKRGLSDEQIIRRMASQLNNCKKLELINSSILNYGHGKVIEINDIYNDDVVWVTMNSICVDGFTKKLS